MNTKKFELSNLDDTSKNIFFSLQEIVMKDENLSELRRLGPLLAGRSFYELVANQAIKAGYHIDDVDHYRFRDLYGACLTGEFWDIIPNV